MLCFNAKRHLYDLTEGNLDEPLAARLKGHIEGCQHCAKEYRELKKVLEIATRVKPPEPSAEFWADFEKGLDEKLAQPDTPAREIRLRPGYRVPILRRPALALATVCAILLLAGTFLSSGLFVTEDASVTGVESLAAEIAVLEELTGEFSFLDDEDLALDELYLQEELG